MMDPADHLTTEALQQQLVSLDAQPALYAQRLSHGYGGAWEESVLPGRLRELRRAQGLTQRALARRAGVPLGAISRLERGQQRRVTPTLLQSLARGLDMTLEELLGVPLRPGSLDLRPLLRLASPARTAIAALIQDIAVIRW